MVTELCLSWGFRSNLDPWVIDNPVRTSPLWAVPKDPVRRPAPDFLSDLVAILVP